MSSHTSHKSLTHNLASALGPYTSANWSYFRCSVRKKKYNKSFSCFLKRSNFKRAFTLSSALVQIHDLDLVGHHQKATQDLDNNNEAPSSPVSSTISSCVAPPHPHCVGRLPRSSRLPFYFATSFFKQMFFCSCLGIAGALEFAIFAIFSSFLASSPLHARFFLYILRTQPGTEFILLSRSLMDG